MVFETLNVREEGAVLFAGITAPPMNLLGPELVRDLVSLIQRAEAEPVSKVLVFQSADPDDFISHRRDENRRMPRRGNDPPHNGYCSGAAPWSTTSGTTCGP